MSEKKHTEEFTYKQMQEMLPDYVFNRLSINETKAFEENLHRYPDLKKEVANVKRVFGKVDRMDIEKRISQRTRNLSIKVKNEMKQKRASKGRVLFGVRYVLPLIGIIVVSIIFYIYFLSLDHGTGQDQQYTKSTFTMVKPQEVLAVISDNTVEEDEYLNAASEMSFDQKDMNVDELIIDKESFIESIDDHLAEMLLEDIEAEEYLNILNDYDLTHDIYIPVDELNEDDFQLILKDIENEDFL